MSKQMPKAVEAPIATDVSGWTDPTLDSVRGTESKHPARDAVKLR